MSWTLLRSASRHSLLAFHGTNPHHTIKALAEIKIFVTYTRMMYENEEEDLRDGILPDELGGTEDEEEGETF